MTPESVSSSTLNSNFGDLANERSQTAAAERIAWIDSAKGLGIILVVTFHAIGGSFSAGLIPRDGILEAAYYVVYTFHMPFFFFLSGLLLKDRLKKQDSAGPLVRSSVLKLLYPYFLWGYIQVAVIFSLGKLVNTPISIGWTDIVSPLWAPPSQFWFLYVLFFLQMIAVFTLTWGAELMLVGIVIIFRVAVAVFDVPGIIETVGLFGIFYAAGILAGPKMKNWPSMIGYPGLMSAALLLATIFLAVKNLESGVGYWSIYALPAAILGTTALLAFSAVPRISSNALLGLLGRRALTIFLTHVLCVAGIRIVMVKLLHISSPWIVLPLAILAGLAVPILAYDLSVKWKLRGFLGFS